MSVYFARAGAYVKIGYSRTPLARMTTITNVGIRPADLPRGARATEIGWVPGDTWTEKAWHTRFLADRVAGEWFYLDPAVVRDAIWDDPYGIDVKRMSAMAVFAAAKYPDVSREQLAAAGLRIEAATLAEAGDRISAILGLRSAA